MARVRDISIDEVPADVQPIYKRFADEYGPFLNQVRVFAHRPPALKHIMGLLLDFADESVLSKRYLEIALVAVSKINECRYCVAHHTPRAIEQGLGAEAVANILEPEIAVTNNWNYIPDAMFTRLREHFSEEQIVELTLRTALCGFFNRFNDSLQIGMEDGVVEDMLSMGGREQDLPTSVHG